MPTRYDIISLKTAISQIRHAPRNGKDYHSYAEIVYALYPDVAEWNFGRVRIALYRIYKQGYEPKGRKLRSLLGLCANETMEVCPIHGVVHTAACPDLKVKPCPSARKYRLASRPDYRLRPVQMMCTEKQYKIILETPTSERAKKFIGESDGNM